MTGKLTIVECVLYIYWRSRDLSQFSGFLDRHGVMTLDRSVGAEAEWTIRCAETFDGSTKAMVRLNVVNLLPSDEIEMSVNGKTIPAESIGRTFHEGGRTDIREGMKLPPYTTVTFGATTPPFEFLTNRLGMKLLRSAEGACGGITVPEIEIAVSAGESDPLEIIGLMKDGPYPEAMETLAGYHPDISAIGPVLMSGDLVENEFIGARTLTGGREAVSAGAQSFVLEDEARICRVELCIYRIPEIREPLRLSLRADKSGVPAEEPIVPGAVAAFDPWDNPDRVCSHMLQGYYRFAFTSPVTLNPGRYWLVLEMDPSAQPPSSVGWGDPPGPSCYAPALTVNAWERYPQGRYMTWSGTEWRRAEKDGKPVIAYFGVLA